LAGPPLYTREGALRVDVAHRASRPATDSWVSTTPGDSRRAVETMWNSWAQSLYNFLLSRTFDRDLAMPCRRRVSGPLSRFVAAAR
jgi:hypothetical protein